MMTEAEWLTCGDPGIMLAWLGGRLNFQLHEPTFRRAALFACACCRRIWTSLSDPRSRTLVEMIERDVDEGVDVKVRWNAEDEAKKAAVEAEFGGFATAAVWPLADLSDEATSDQTDSIADTASEAYALAQLGERDPLSSIWIVAVKEERRYQASLLRDIFGNPFCPMTFSHSWRTDTAVALASQMYDSRDFSAMPILADALQDAGCDNDDILTHCRDPKQPHVRGCWVVDLILDKE